jgi:hypothetical protein
MNVGVFYHAVVELGPWAKSNTKSACVEVMFDGEVGVLDTV